VSCFLGEGQHQKSNGSPFPTQLTLTRFVWQKSQAERITRGEPGCSRQGMGMGDTRGDNEEVCMQAHAVSSWRQLACTARAGALRQTMPKAVLILLVPRLGAGALSMSEHRTQTLLRLTPHGVLLSTFLQ
jgi:hypothetical protein